MLAKTARFGLLSHSAAAWSVRRPDFVSTWRYYESVIATDYLTLPLGWYLPADRLKQLEPFVAADPADVFDLSDFPEGSMASIIDAQLRAFGSMKDNPTNMGVYRGGARSSELAGRFFSDLLQRCAASAVFRIKAA